MALLKSQGSVKNPALLAELSEIVSECNALRTDPVYSQDISLGEYILERQQLSLEGFYQELSIDPSVDTIQNLINFPDPNMRWLVPEIYRDAIRLGLRKNPIYPDIIAGEQSVSQTSVTFPAINMSEAKPKYVGPGETITTGDVSFDQKSVKIHKLGRGIRVPYEIIQYVALNVLGIFMEDYGVKMAMGLDTLMITTLINGDQAGGIDSCPVIGINTANTLVFRDLLRPWVRLARMGKSPTVMIGGETMSMDILDLLVTTRYFGDQRATAELKLKSPMPTSANIYVHGTMPDKQVMMIDRSNCIVKLNAQPLLVEVDKIVQNQTMEAYATVTTGFATILKDSRLIMDETLAFSGNGFPTYLDPTTSENVVFD